MAMPFCIECESIFQKAVDVEQSKRSLESYQLYLSCCSKATAALLEDCRDLQPQNFDSRLRLAKILHQSSEKIVKLWATQGISQSQPQRASAIQPHSPSNSASNGLHGRIASPLPPTSPLTSPPLSRTSSTSSTDGNYKGTSVRRRGPAKGDMLLLARYQCKIIREHLNQRLRNSNYQQQRQMNMKLDVERRCEEIMRLAEKKQSKLDEELFERHQKLKALTSERIASLNLQNEELKRQHEQLHTAMLLHEEENPWIYTLKSQLLSTNDQLNMQKAEELCNQILGNVSNPLTILMREYQQSAKTHIGPIIQQYKNILISCVRVPYQYSDPPATDEEMKQLDTEAEQKHKQKNFEEHCKQTSKDLAEAVEQNEGEVDKLERLENKNTRIQKAVEKHKHQEDDLIDEMEFLFDEDNADDFYPTSHQKKLYSPTKTDLEEVVSLESGFQAQLKCIIDDLLECAQLIRTSLLLAYKELNTDEGFDIVTNSIYSHLFDDIQPDIDLLFRLANIKKECVMAETMSLYKDADMEAFRIPEKWRLGTNGECYSMHISKLASLPTINSPLHKLSCAIKSYKGVIETVSNYYLRQGKQELMGADDLMPIVCYILAKTQAPQMLSQIDLILQFIPAEYLQGEEGYCLATFEVATQALLDPRRVFKD